MNKGHSLMEPFVNTSEMIRELNFAEHSLNAYSKQDLIRLVRLSRNTIERISKSRKNLKQKNASKTLSIIKVLKS